MTTNQKVLDRDGNWLRQSFLVPRTRARLADQRSQLFQDVDVKFTDSSLGGNLYINPVPQWCRYTDIRRKGRNKRNFATKDGIYDGSGQGRYHSEAIDDNAQVIYMRFGVPEFNSLTTFFTGFYDSEASLLARSGRGPGLFYTAGRATGFILSLPLAPLIAAGAAYRWIAQNPASKYYYFKPTMPLYWNCVNIIANNIVANSGIYPRINLFGNDKAHVVNGPEAQEDAVFGADLNADLHRMAPDIYWEGGGIDIYAVANKATRMAHAERNAQIAALEQHTSTDDLARRIRDFFASPVESSGKVNGKRADLDSILGRYVESNAGRKEGPAGTEGDANLQEPTGGGVVVEDKVKPGWWASLLGDEGHLWAELADGSAFVGFRVNHTGPSDESFSNQSGESSIASSINSQSSSARDIRFSFGNGNVSDGVLGNMVEGMVGAVKDFAAGNLDSIGASGIAALYGSAFVDIPEHWQNSVFNAPSTSYTLELRSPYGNKLSIFNNVILQMTMLLAGALPRSTGKHSYTSPFLVQLYSKGRQQIRLGMIDSITISRGVGNVGWTTDGRFLGADVRFSVKDLSSIMHMPMAPDAFPNPLRGTFDEDSTFNDYMATLGSLGLMDQIYISRRLELALTKSMVRFRSWSSPARFANWANGTLPGRIANTISRELDRG